MNLLLIKSFLSSKTGKYSLISLLILSILGYTYYKGYSSGKNEQIKIYNNNLAKALKEQEKRLEIEKKEAIKLVESQKKTEKIYIKGKDTVRIIKDNNIKLSSKECSLNKEDAVKFNNAIKEVLE